MTFPPCYRHIGQVASGQENPLTCEILHVRWTVDCLLHTHDLVDGPVFNGAEVLLRDRLVLFSNNSTGRSNETLCSARKGEEARDTDIWRPRWRLKEDRIRYCLWETSQRRMLKSVNIDGLS